jgi:hypothetical protein
MQQQQPHKLAQQTQVAAVEVHGIRRAAQAALALSLSVT